MNPDQTTTSTMQQPQVTDSRGQQFMKAIQFAQQNPTNPASLELMNRIKSGQMNDYMQAAGFNPNDPKFGIAQPQTQTTQQQPQQNDSNPITNINNDLGARGKQFAEAITQAPQRAKQIGTVPAVGEAGLRAAGAAAGGLVDFASDAVKAIPGVSGVLNRIQQNLTDPQNGGVVGKIGAQLMSALNGFAAKHPEATKDLSSVLDIVTAVGGMKGLQEAGAKLPEAVQGVKSAASNIVKTSPGATSDSAVWDMIKPKLSADELNQAAREGGIVKKGVLGTVTQLPQEGDKAMIEAATPYVKSGDPIGTLANMKTAVADESSALRSAVGSRGGTWSTSNLKGLLGEVKVPLAIKDTAEMTQVRNVNKFVTMLADSVDKNAGGALDLSKKFRAQINAEFGENIWSKDTPIASYIRNVNRALNDQFIPKLLPEGKLPDGTTVADSFKKQTLLYRAMDNIQVPKEGSNILTRAEAKIKQHPVVSTLTAAGGIMGAAEGLKHLP